MLEIKVGAGAFTDIGTAGGSFTSGGYTTTLNSGNAFGARSAWSGTNGTFTPVVVNLPTAAAGQSVQFRWRCGTDASISKTGWWVDSVAVSGPVCCGNASAPVILTHPQSTSVPGGSPANFSVFAVGNAPLGYQWYFNSNLLAGATATNYFIASAGATNAGIYFVIVTNGSGSVTSSVATLTVIMAPVITQPPASQIVLIGQPANFTVTAIGAPTLMYQWRKNSNNLAGATGTNYLIASVAPGDTGSYDVVVTNFSGSVTSSIAVLTAVSPASYSGVLAGWDMTALSNFGPSPFAPTTNAPNLLVAGLTRGSGIATNLSSAARGWGGSAFNYASAASAYAANAYATFSFTVSNGYTLSFSSVSKYDYRRSSSGPVSGLLQYKVGSGAFTDVTTYAYSSSSSSGASLAAVNLSGIAALQNIPAGTNVTFLLINYGASLSTGTWYVYDRTTPGVNDFEITGSLAPVAVVTPPVITIPPSPTNVFAGNNAGFQVTATGSGPLNYQWLKGSVPLTNGGTISGAQTNALNFIPAATNHTAGYSVIVTNLGGGVTSSVVLLNVVPVPALLLSNTAGELVIGAENGAVSNRFIVQMATNLVSPVVWVPIQTNIIGTNAQIRFTETNCAAPFRFYRLLFP